MLLVAWYEACMSAFGLWLFPSSQYRRSRRSDGWMLAGRGSGTTTPQGPKLLKKDGQLQLVVSAADISDMDDVQRSAARCRRRSKKNSSDFSHPVSSQSADVHHCHHCLPLKLTLKLTDARGQSIMASSTDLNYRTCPFSSGVGYPMLQTIGHACVGLRLISFGGVGAGP